MNRHSALLVLAVLLVAPASAVQSNAIVARPARLLARPPAVAMAARNKPPAGQARKQAASDEKKGLDATLPSLLYYGCYSLFFGKMLLVIFERISGA